jgi:hypothetical protein
MEGERAEGPNVAILRAGRLSFGSGQAYEHLMNNSTVPKRRLLISQAIVAVLIIGALVSIVTDRELWPFSPYPMYSYAQQDYSSVRMRLYGVTQDTEIPLRDSGYLQPFDITRLSQAFDSINTLPNRQKVLEEALVDSLTRYEELRREGLP